MSEGFIYILWNYTHQPDIFKIGQTQLSPETRANQLSSETGVLGKFKVIHSEKLSDCVQGEKEVHQELKSFRIETNKEFFQLSRDHAIKIVFEVARKYPPKPKIKGKSFRLNIEKIHDLQTDHFQFTSLAFPPKNKYLAGAALGQKYFSWDLRNGKFQNSDGRKSSSSVEENAIMAFSPNGKMLAMIVDHSVDLQVSRNIIGNTLWGIFEKSRWLQSRGKRIKSLAFSPDDKCLVTAFENTIQVWKLTETALKPSLPKCWKEFTSAHGDIKSLKFGDQKNIFFVGCSDGSILVWDIKENKEQAIFKEGAYEIKTIDISKYGILASGGKHKQIDLWNTKTGEKLGQLSSGVELTSFKFWPEGNLLVTGNKEGLIQYWDTDSGHSFHEIPAHIGAIRTMAFSLDGKMLASSSEAGSVKLWKTEISLNNK